MLLLGFFVLLCLAPLFLPPLPFVLTVPLYLLLILCYLFSSIQFSCSVMSDSLRPHRPQHTRPPCLSSTPRVYTNSCPLNWWCHPAISSSVVPFFSYPLSFPASGSFQMSQLFASGGQSVGVSASTSVLPMNIQDWSPLGWTGWISLQSKGLSRVFSNTTVQKHHKVSHCFHCSVGSSKKNKRASEKHLFLLYWLCQSLWLCGSQ